MTTTFTIDGAAIRGISSFYDEVNRVFMADEDWRLGETLDGLNDLLHGGFGAMSGDGDVRVVWRDHRASRRALGHEATAEYYREKLRHPERFDAARFRRLLEALPDGPTYFDKVMEVFADHPRIELVLA